MSQDTPSSGGLNVPPVAPGSSANSDETLERVFLVSYPNIIFMYPTVLASLFCSIFMWFKGDLPPEAINLAAGADSKPQMALASAVSQVADQANPSGTHDTTVPTVPAAAATHTYHNFCARIFLIVFTLNMVVLAFDFPRTTSLTWFFAIVALSIGLWFILTMNPGLAPKILHGLLSITPAANASFYMIFTASMLFLFICVLISRRFDYWEVKGNELLHHHGFLSNLERFSAPSLRIDKEITDLFEHILLRSGRLIIHASQERRAIVLENVLFINQKEDRITKMLGALQVRVRTDRE